MVAICKELNADDKEGENRVPEPYVPVTSQVPPLISHMTIAMQPVVPLHALILSSVKWE